MYFSICFGRMLGSLTLVDIEGAEWLALNGAGETLEKSDAQDFLIEFHPEEIQALSGTMKCCLQKLQVAVSNRIV
jgi:hypothetical protein